MFCLHLFHPRPHREQERAGAIFPGQGWPDPGEELLQGADPSVLTVTPPWPCATDACCLAPRAGCGQPPTHGAVQSLAGWPAGPGQSHGTSCACGLEIFKQVLQRWGFGPFLPVKLELCLLCVSRRAAGDTHPPAHPAPGGHPGQWPAVACGQLGPSCHHKAPRRTFSVMPEVPATPPRKM